MYDGRDARPGVKFNDGDVIGLPVRLTVSRRALRAGGVEFKRRDQEERRVVELDAVLTAVQAAITELQGDLSSQLATVDFKE